MYIYNYRPESGDNSSGSEVTFATLLAAIEENKQSNPGNVYDIRKIMTAYDLAESAHRGQQRKSGELYITHPLAVALILIELHSDNETVLAALLHDVVEDTDIPLDYIRHTFGKKVAELVDGVTKIKQVKLKKVTDKAAEEYEDYREMFTSPAVEAKNESFRKMLLGMSKDVRVLVIKLADRLHNMRTLDSLAPEKQRRIALETVNFYAPLAHRIGMANFKEELENRAFYYLDRYAYDDIESNLTAHHTERTAFVEKLVNKIKELLCDMTPQPEVYGRVKGVYSLYQKMYTSGKSLEEIYDLFAVRVIVESSASADCYGVLGVIHEMFKPMPGRFKDYIANPKNNGYRSLHTVLLGKDGQPFEVQIRTREMHRTARFGIAAHWRYKLGSDVELNHENRFAIIQNLLNQQQYTDDMDMLFSGIRNDLSPNEISVYTPQSDIVSLPLGSTVVDFAYKIHTEIGSKMKDAKVNGKVVDIGQVLENGNLVEIRTDENAAPDFSWLTHAKTAIARNKISHQLRTERQSECLQRGIRFVYGVIKKENYNFRNNHEKDKFINAFTHKYGHKNLNDFMTAIGCGALSEETAKKRIRTALESYIIETECEREQCGNADVLIEGLSGDALCSEHGTLDTSETDEHNELDELNELIESGVAPVPVFVPPARATATRTEAITVDGITDCPIKFANCCNPLPGDRIIGFITQGHGVSVHREKCGNITERLSVADCDKAKMYERLVSVKWNDKSAGRRYTSAVEIIATDRVGLLMDTVKTISDCNVLIIGNNTRTDRNGGALLNFTVEVTGAAQLNKLIERLEEIESVVRITRH